MHPDRLQLPAGCCPRWQDTLSCGGNVLWRVGLSIQSRHLSVTTVQVLPGSGGWGGGRGWRPAEQVPGGCPRCEVLHSHQDSEIAGSEVGAHSPSGRGSLLTGWAPVLHHGPSCYLGPFSESGGSAPTLPASSPGWGGRPRPVVLLSKENAA